jgi:N-methylhydantoinase A/oxoprolinase/acetone carboxylase beta subunit
MKIGMDIGGTHTDTVLVENGKIIQAYKTLTTTPLEEGVRRGLSKVAIRHSIESVNIGTTHATNALLEAKNLFRTGVIRLAGHDPTSLRPCFQWPQVLRQKVFAGMAQVGGGYECDLREISPFDAKQVREAAKRLVLEGAESFAITGVFSPIFADQEKQAEEAIREVLGERFPISLSHQIGGIGFIERENATILNAALKRPMQEGFSRLREVMEDLGIEAPLFITQNNGSVIDLKQAIEYPLLTLSSGPTNSFIGACRLAGLSDAVVVDIGGTSTDIGLVKDGYPRRSIHNVCFGGVSLNFRTPDVLALPLGGGSVITEEQIGPESVGSQLMAHACIFGGESLTLTDVACKAGVFEIPGADLDRVKLSISEAECLIKKARSQITYAVMKMKGRASTLPVIAVGGGAAFAGSLAGSLADILPIHQSVANAYGAALAEVSATVDTVVSLAQREQTLERLSEKVLQLAVDKGAAPASVRIVDLQVIPYHYVPNQLARVIVTASGK